MKPTTFLLFFALFASLCSLGIAAPDFTARDCTLHAVTTSSRKIVMIVSGECRFPVVQRNEGETGSIGTAITAQMDHTVIVIPRRDGATSPSEYRPYESWDDYSRQIKALEGKRIVLQLASDQTLFQQMRLSFVSCIYASLVREFTR